MMRPIKPDPMTKALRDAQELADQHGVAYLIVRPQPKRLTGCLGDPLLWTEREDQADADDRRNTVLRVVPGRAK